jgi:hypothetical protein
MTKPVARRTNFFGPFDEQVPSFQEGVRKHWLKLQKGLSNKSLKLSRADADLMSGILVGFSEDIHCDVGIWAAYERINRRLFGTPLPLVVSPQDAQGGDPGLYLRLRHLLWVIYPQLVPGLLLRPSHADLAFLAQEVAEFLKKQLSRLPNQSGLKAFLDVPNKWAWDIKRKLVWLGTESYMLGPMFGNAAAEIEEESERPLDEIEVIDEFICTGCTAWSGLGALDVLSEQQALPEERRTELLAWSARLFAPYRVVSASNEVLCVVNLVNEKPYSVRMNLERNPFSKDRIVMGALIPWDGEWYWSGRQHLCDERESADEVRRRFMGKPSLVYRSCPDRLAKAREVVRNHHDEFVSRHGTDYAVYDSGFALSSDWKAAAKSKFDALPLGEQKSFLKRQNMSSYAPRISIPPEVVECRSGIGAFSNPESGLELMRNFGEVLSALKKKGQGLTDMERETLLGWIESPSISPAFVKRFVGEYGAQSVFDACFVDRSSDAYTLEYLLRCHKGMFYRTQHPSLSLID